ncbi:hypothetical protein BaRGS_00001250 [Batillaria attramentaria]|uniref:Uncharacterized protein n=1 Tax=Batillaria attramentaria TaxID=370345 RepID=A0ABD0M747_9CAEN
MLVDWTDEIFWRVFKCLGVFTSSHAPGRTTCKESPVSMSLPLACCQHLTIALCSVIQLHKKKTGLKLLRSRRQIRKRFHECDDSGKVDVYEFDDTGKVDVYEFDDTGKVDVYEFDDSGKVDVYQVDNTGKINVSEFDDVGKVDVSEFDDSG